MEHLLTVLQFRSVMLSALTISSFNVTEISELSFIKKSAK